MGLLRVAVFGPPEVFHDERRLSFALRKAETLLLYLAVEGGMHSRSQLAALLWPDSEPSLARQTLRNALALLRSLLADAPAAGHSHLLQEPELLGLMQFEFVKKQWINDGTFFGVPAEMDPLVGPHDGNGQFTIPQQPIRRRLTELPRFVVNRGGEYCFIPGLRALQWLADLDT